MKPNIKLKTVGILKEIAILRAENKVLKTMIEDANNRESGRAELSRATEAMKVYLEINDRGVEK